MANKSVSLLVNFRVVLVAFEMPLAEGEVCPVADELILRLFVVVRINFESDFPLQLLQIIQIIATGRFTDVQS